MVVHCTTNTILNSVCPDDRLGVVSDSHGQLRPEVLTLLSGVGAIIHAGDVGNQSVLEKLGRIAPVYAVRGNIDNKTDCDILPEQLVLNVWNKRIMVKHTVEHGDVQGFDLAICGHSHSPKISRLGKVSLLNPGSIGPRRFKLPISMAYITLSHHDTLMPELITI